jgi:hypothetical protein
VDEPWQDKREKERQAAKKAMAAYQARAAAGADDASEGLRKMLVKVAEDGPWTPEAWEAVKLMGIGAGK